MLSQKFSSMWVLVSASFFGGTLDLKDALILRFAVLKIGFHSYLTKSPFGGVG